jgi:hypothetical protein
MQFQAFSDAPASFVGSIGPWTVTGAALARDRVCPEILAPGIGSGSPLIAVCDPHSNREGIRHSNGVSNPIDGPTIYLPPRLPEAGTPPLAFAKASFTLESSTWIR